MDVILAKIFAAALTFSQVATAPDALKTHFDPATDQGQVTHLLRAGCEHVRKSFDAESINLDDLIATAMEDPEAVAGTQPAFRGINIADLQVAYRQFCKNETVASSPIDLAQVIEYYNRALDDLPDVARLADPQSAASIVLDGNGNKLAEVFPQGQRRVLIPLAEIPAQVQSAFVTAEDKRFYEHNGIDDRAVIRAFVENLSQTGRPQGGSTITQQVVKNLLVGDEVTYERKMREMVLASRASVLSRNRKYLSFISTRFFLAALLGASRWRPAAISGNPRAN
jgi:hypothetical protein